MIASTTAWLYLSLHVFSCPLQTLALFPYTNMRKSISPNQKGNRGFVLPQRGTKKCPILMQLQYLPLLPNLQQLGGCGHMSHSRCDYSLQGYHRVGVLLVRLNVDHVQG